MVASRFTDWRQLLAEVEGLDAVAITTPPSVRYEIARACIEDGLHIWLESHRPARWARSRISPALPKRAR